MHTLRVLFPPPHLALRFENNELSAVRIIDGFHFRTSRETGSRS